MPSTRGHTDDSSRVHNRDALLGAVRNRMEAELKASAAHQGGGLYIVATPIGNLSDITLRALAILATSEIIFAEDTRHSAHLLQHFQINTHLKSSHDHNEDRRIDEILDRLSKGQRVAIISDAGTPLISDPGYKIVRAAATAGHNVYSVPGSSAVLAALTSSGLPTDTFLFAGFLPAKQAARRRRLEGLAQVPATLVFYEAPSRIAASCQDMAQILGYERFAVVARELTKRYEEIRRGPLVTLAGDISDASLKGEMVVVVSPPPEVTITDDEIIAELSKRLPDQSLKDVARAISDQHQVSRSKVYELGLALKRQQQSS
ncbi:MAG: 16S rRNA (cytidine(1402)-2'-O)-methyltransferase [Hyphomicrobiaceae bacterium]